jgi:hypothetical protein
VHSTNCVVGLAKFWHQFFKPKAHAYEHGTHKIVIPPSGLQHLAFPSQYSEARESLAWTWRVYCLPHVQLSKKFESQYWCTKFIQGKAKGITIFLWGEEATVSPPFSLGNIAPPVRAFCPTKWKSKHLEWSASPLLRFGWSPRPKPFTYYSSQV